MGILKSIFGRKETRRSPVEKKPKIKKSFVAYANGRGLKDYPCNSKNYSPSSRYPCTDFSPWIMEALRSKNHKGIADLICEIVRANPGMGFGSDDGVKQHWQQQTKRVISFDIEKHISATDQEVYTELRAINLLILLHHDFNGFILTAQEVSQAVAGIIAARQIKFKHLKELEKKANRFIRKMRKDTPYWEEFDLFKNTPDEISVSTDGLKPEFVQKYLDLPLVTRIHLLDIAMFQEKKRLKHPSEMTVSVTRQLGIDPDESTKILIDKGLLSPISDVDKVTDSLKKDELLNLASSNGVDVRKSWNKGKIAQAIIDYNHSILLDKAQERGFMKISSEFDSDITKLKENIDTMILPLTLIMGFAYQGS